MEIVAEALPALGQAWGLILQPIVLGYLVLGVVMGLCIGVFPGLGGIAGLSLLLPFMFVTLLTNHSFLCRRSDWALRYGD